MDAMQPGRCRSCATHALGKMPLIVELLDADGGCLEALKLPDVELLTDFQLQVEYLLDMAGRAEVVFIDATVSGEGPFHFAPIEALAEHSYPTHALAPSALLAA